jgi:hypothetical protein
VHSDSVNEVFSQKDTLARERNTRRELRAYLTIIDFERINIDPNKPIEFIPIVKNTGRTQANKIKVWNYFTINIEQINQDTIKNIVSEQTPLGELVFIGAEQSQKLIINGTDLE